MIQRLNVTGLPKLLITIFCSIVLIIVCLFGISSCNGYFSSKNREKVRQEMLANYEVRKNLWPQRKVQLKVLAISPANKYANNKNSKLNRITQSVIQDKTESKMKIISHYITDFVEQFNTASISTSSNSFFNLSTNSIINNSLVYPSTKGGSMVINFNMSPQRE